MQEQEHDELLYRLDERTERIEQELVRRVERVEEKTIENRKAIDTIDDRVQKNETRMNYVAGGVGTITTAAVAWLAKILGLLRGIV